MAITRAAKKAIRGSARRRVFNLRRKRTMKEVLKNISTKLKEGKVMEAKALMPRAQRALDKAAKMNIIRKGKAARDKSRLSTRIKAASKH